MVKTTAESADYFKQFYVKVSISDWNLVKNKQN